MPENFPSTTDFLSNYKAKDRWATTLSAAINDTVTIIPLTSVTGLVAGEAGWVTIDGEHIYYDYVDIGGLALGSATYPVTRGVDSSTATSHASGSSVEQRINAVAFRNVLDSIKKRTEYSLSCAQVAADTVSEQNISSFASRAQVHEFRIAAIGGSTQFKVELYRKDTFRGEDKIYETIELSSVESAIDQSSASGQKNIYVTSTTGFLVDELVQLENSDRSVIEFALVADIVAGASLESYSNLVNTFDTNSKAVLVNRDQKSFYYEDLDWTSELHVKVINLDTSNSVTVYLDIIAEVSDEA